MRIAIFVLSTALASAGAACANTPLLDRAALAARVVGNTIHYHAPDEDIFEYLAPDGSIHGESTVHGKYTARWRFLENDALCFDHDDPMQSGCVGVVLKKGLIEYHRRDGVIEGPFEFLRGNPRAL